MIFSGFKIFKTSLVRICCLSVYLKISARVEHVRSCLFLFAKI